MITIGEKYRVKSGEGEIFDVGPASYNTQTYFYKDRGVSFTKSRQRPETGKESSRLPGPNNYSSLSAKKVKGKILA